GGSTTLRQPTDISTPNCRDEAFFGKAPRSVSEFFMGSPGHQRGGFCLPARWRPGLGSMRLPNKDDSHGRIVSSDLSTSAQKRRTTEASRHREKKSELEGLALTTTGRRLQALTLSCLLCASVPLWFVFSQALRQQPVDDTPFAEQLDGPARRRHQF